MEPLTTSALLSAVPSALQTGAGLIQSIKANKLKKDNKQPVYERPGEIQRYTDIAQSRAASTKLAGQDRIEEKIGAAGANVRRAAADAADPMSYLQTVSEVAGRESEQIADLGIAASQDKARREKEAQDALLLSAEYADKEFQINKLDPYLQGKAAESALRESAGQNIIGGLTGLAGTASSMIGIPGGEKTTVTDGAVSTTPTGVSASDPKTTGYSQEDLEIMKTLNPALYKEITKQGV